MTVDVVQFKLSFPEFAPNADEQVNFWLTDAVSTLNPVVLGDRYDQAVMLYAAHNISSSMMNRRAVAAGGVPGQNVGPTISRSVGPVSKSMGTFGIDQRAGEYNNTTYGRRLFAMLKASVAGGFYRAVQTRLPIRPPNAYLGYPGYDPSQRRW